MMENMLLAQQKQDEYINQLASKVDVLATHNKMLEAQIAQQATSSSTPIYLINLSLIPMSSVTVLPHMTLEEDKEVIMAKSEEKNDEVEPIMFREKDSFQFPKVFPPKLPDPGNFFIPCVVGKVKINRAICDLSASVSLMPYSMFHKFHWGPL